MATRRHSIGSCAHQSALQRRLIRRPSVRPSVLRMGLILMLMKNGRVERADLIVALTAGVDPSPRLGDMDYDRDLGDRNPPDWSRGGASDSTEGFSFWGRNSTKTVNRRIFCIRPFFIGRLFFWRPPVRVRGTSYSHTSV